MAKTDDKITELLLRWEESSEHGADVSVEELCRACPELVEVVKQKINALKEMVWVTKDDDPPEDVEDDIPRTLAGRYQLTERIAVGGFGQVGKHLTQDLNVRLPSKSQAIERPINRQFLD